MKSNSAIFILGLFFVLGCNESTKQSNREQGAEHEQKYTVFSFDPESCTPLIVDTLLDSSTNLELEIKKYCFENKGFEVPFDLSEDTVEVVFNRDFAVELKLVKQGKIIFTEKFEKRDFESQIEDEDFLSLATITWASLESYNIKTQEIKIKLMICQIESDYAYIFAIKIDSKGNKEVNLIEVT